MAVHSAVFCISPISQLWQYITQCFVYLLHLHKRYYCQCLFYHVMFTEIQWMWWCGLCRCWLRRALSYVTTLLAAARWASRQLLVIIRLGHGGAPVLLPGCAIDSKAGWQEGPTFVTWPIYWLRNALTHNQVIQLLMIWDHLRLDSVWGVVLSGCGLHHGDGMS